MPFQAVIAGATGLIGSELLNRLLNDPQYNRITAITRRPLPAEDSRLNNPVTDFSHLDEITDEIHGDIFFSCLGTTRKQAGSVAAQRTVDYDYQLRLAQIAAGNGIPHYCLVSSASANAASLSPYLKMKGELENAVVKLGFTTVTIIQPSLLLGQRAEKRAGESFAGLVMPCLLYIPGLKRYRPIHGYEVAEKMHQVAEKTLSEPTPGTFRYTLDQVFPAS